MSLIVLLGVAVVLVALLAGMYNGLVGLRNRAAGAWAEDMQLCDLEIKRIILFDSSKKVSKELGQADSENLRGRSPGLPKV